MAIFALMRQRNDARPIHGAYLVQIETYFPFPLQYLALIYRYRSAAASETRGSESLERYVEAGREP